MNFILLGRPTSDGFSLIPNVGNMEPTGGMQSTRRMLRHSVGRPLRSYITSK